MKNLSKILLLLIIPAMLYGCMAAPRPDLVWPEAPDPPRIRYMTSYRGTTDFGGGSVASAILLGASTGGVLKKPMGVYVDTDGKVYVTDTAASDVYILDPVNKKGTTVGDLGSKFFYKPIGVSTDSKGRIFVADSQTDKVGVLDSNGKLLSYLSPEDPLKQPTGLAIDKERNKLYVTDTHSHSIKVFDTETLKQIGTIGKRGKEEGSFNFPSHITVDNEGKLYVVDTMNGRVQIFDPDGRFIRTFGQFGDAPGMFARPKGIGVDSEGHIYVVDSAFNNVQIFDQEGRVLLAFASYGSDRGQMILPAGLAVDKDDKVYVVDSWNRRVEVFEFMGTKYYKRNNLPIPEHLKTP
ncbi:MAG: 6-bladed beta-propeller, partial [Deltaproteobacteria bacterium]|nr:6-bladed beta-propeller [Deltaproteobacteria bacterium]